MKPLIFLVLCLTASLSLSAKPRSGSYAGSEVDELRIELEDLKHALHVTQVDLSLLDEQSKKQENSLGKQIKDTQNTTSVASQLGALEKKVSSLEKTLDKITADLRTLNSALSQTTGQIQQLQTHLSTQEDKLNEVGKLKGTLASIAKSMGSGSKTYKVKAGDSLEKIAKAHHTTVESIRKINALSQDKIIVGQELRIGHDPS